ncbi:hypothetical protein RHGRI_003259 [Rhododendron griersonianum]|uniref:Uncharacterized protein n=1 Tax=Rhododendron griersonianum TaxID=479676 RepID=A0AAV6L6J4_9ERIC|nr:hypothetical protein RHGRI_003259 [Rhododendron griersonianum]
MHDDICTLALEKSTSILIFPFQKSDNSPVPGVIKNVLDKAPCSVGILVDKKIIMHWRSESRNQARLSVCVVFLGGPDAREALAYGMRRVANPTIRLTVLRLIAEDEFASDIDSPLVKGLVDWSHAQELGIIGDMLASSDMKCSASVLVVQQQFTVEDLAHAHED